MVVRLYSPNNPSSGHFIKRNIYATVRVDHGSIKGGLFNGQGRGIGFERRGGKLQGGHSVRGGCGSGRSTYENGVYISYIICYFEDEEWAALSNESRRRIT